MAPLLSASKTLCSSLNSNPSFNSEQDPSLIPSQHNRWPKSQIQKPTSTKNKEHPNEALATSSYRDGEIIKGLVSWDFASLSVFVLYVWNCSLREEVGRFEVEVSKTQQPWCWRNAGNYVNGLDLLLFSIFCPNSEAAYVWWKLKPCLVDDIWCRHVNCPMICASSVFM